MKYIVLLFALLHFALPSKAEYGYMHIARLICEADYGAVGTIVKLDKSYFYLKVEGYILDKLEFDTLKIQRFADWPCGRRFYEYQIGQKELVFFRKSNYVIGDFELLGYGGGDEFELPIKDDSIYYSCAFNRLWPYSLDSILTAVKDFSILRQKLKETSLGISLLEQEEFAARSWLHKYLIQCITREPSEAIELPTSNYILNLEHKNLYQDYENKVFIFGFNIDSVELIVDDAEVWKSTGYFIVKPKDAWTRRWLSVYSINDTVKDKSLYGQIFEVLELPEPRIYFGSSYRDTAYVRSNVYPRAALYLDDMHEDEYLKYELLSYTYTIRSTDSVEIFKMKNQRGTIELYERIRKLKPLDQIEISDVYVLYPNKTVKKIKGRSVVVGQRF
jgi:hypothetical protein